METLAIRAAHQTDARYLAYVDAINAVEQSHDLLVEKQQFWTKLLADGVPEHLQVVVARATAGAYMGFLIGVREPENRPPQEYRMVVTPRFSALGVAKALLEAVGHREDVPESIRPAVLESKLQREPALTA